MNRSTNLKDKLLMLVAGVILTVIVTVIANDLHAWLRSRSQKASHQLICGYVMARTNEIVIIWNKGGESLDSKIKIQPNFGTTVYCAYDWQGEKVDPSSYDITGWVFDLKVRSQREPCFVVVFHFLGDTSGEKSLRTAPVLSVIGNNDWKVSVDEL